MATFKTDSLKIFKSLDHNKIRIGKNNDGGYIILDGFEYDFMIGCGIFNDISFEHDFLKKYPKLNCIAFDGTIDKLPKEHPRIEFVKKNINVMNSNKTENLYDLMKKYSNIFLKIDIEGGEYPWIHNLTLDQLSQFSQIVIEFHSKCEGLKAFDQQKISVLEKLAKTHYLVHLHGNNWEPTTGYYDKVIRIGSSKTNTKILNVDCPNDTKLTFYHKYPDKFFYQFENKKLFIKRIDKISGWGQDLIGYVNFIKIPNVFECTYVRKDLLQNVIHSDEPIPGPLDQPNHEKRKDIVLKGHPYNSL